ncbi:sensor domain-containing diguanylate cyclase [Nitrincola iocasae]|uniref:diguanylate cyclase n=1 Tax=Nitrincola iocasae TaxID=2614693 RepID=A0A5J6LC73_9GAMM|nr:GGDEF domain-containing protein [Nitrincola iocasae]QEW06006.1 GGDEF domain-containing protein [Nitrincola iocasae]
MISKKSIKNVTSQTQSSGPEASCAQMLLESSAELLPTPDGVALAIMEAWENENTTVQQIARLVQMDPSLTGRILKLANSAATGRRPVASVPEAIVRVGIQTVGQLAVAFSLIGNESVINCPAFNHQKYWTRCLLMAVLSRGLAKATQVAPPDDIFACGLLARIGVLGLASVYPEAYSNILSTPRPDLIVQEKETFGIDHNELSEAMMVDFCVPRALAEPARYHENPTQSGFEQESRPHKIMTLLHLAYHLSEVAIRDDGNLTVKASTIKVICAQLKLQEGRIDIIFNQALDDWREWSEIFNLSTDEAQNYTDLDFDVADSFLSPNEPVTSSVETLSAAIVADAEIFDLLSGKLTQLGFPALHCEKATAAMQLAMNRQANVFFVSQKNTQFIDMLRGAKEFDASYVFFMLAKTDAELEAKAYLAGADDVITNDIRVTHLKARLKPAMRMLKRYERWRNDRTELRRIAKELSLSHRQQQLLALTDQLTELPNRRAAMEALDQAWSGSIRSQTPCSLLILDIDHFKNINDNYGHDVGDEVLRAVAIILKTNIRREDTIARIGGEEFLLISPHLPTRDALVAAERLRKQLENAKIDAGGETICITMSIGMAMREDTMRHGEDLMISADKALYAAKNAGRNRIALNSAGQIRMLKNDK